MSHAIEYIQALGLGASLLFALLLHLGLIRIRGKRSAAQPAVSVLVAARDEEKALPSCLASLSAQDYPAGLCEFIIVDDVSSDRTAEIVELHQSQDARFRLLRLRESPERDKGPKKRALEAGVRISRGEIILVTDADCIAPAGWITAMAAAFGDDADVVCGSVRYAKSATLWANIAAFEGLANTILNAAVIGLGGALSCAGANLAYRRAAFLDAGGFDRDPRSFSGDDDLLIQSLKSHGRKIRFCLSPQALIVTEAPQNSASYWRRKRRHLSAGRRYARHWMALAALVYIGSISTVMLSLMRLCGAQVNSQFLWLWAAFSLILWTLFLHGSALLRERRWRNWALLGAVVFPWVYALIQPLTLFSAPGWKGRQNIRRRRGPVMAEAAHEI